MTMDELNQAQAEAMFDQERVKRVLRCFKGFRKQLNDIGGDAILRNGRIQILWGSSGEPEPNTRRGK